MTTNLDPRPWIDTDGERFAGPPASGMAVLDPRIEFDIRSNPILADVAAGVEAEAMLAAMVDPARLDEIQEANDVSIPEREYAFEVLERIVTDRILA